MRETVEIMRYPVTLTPAPEGGYMVSFVDIPEALTQGETVAEAMEAAKDALLTAFDFYFEDNELIPLPSPLNSHDHFIEVPLSVASKVLLLNAFLQSEITQQELARRIGKPKQEITRLFNLHHATKIDAVQLAERKQRAWQALLRYLPAEVKIHHSDSGYFLWLELPEPLDAGELSLAALTHHISIAPGKMFSTGENWSRFFRFNTAWQWGEREEQAVKQLGKLIQERL